MRSRLTHLRPLSCPAVPLHGWERFFAVTRSEIAFGAVSLARHGLPEGPAGSGSLLRKLQAFASCCPCHSEAA